eukprot:Mrub_07223.p1 GENE.Mrub_07223~~Mrub_07223.p1  ORF type:complete len:291 (+),score=35.17 Mrub_07223:74-874(+)
MHINDYLDAAREQKLNNRLTRGLKQRIYMLGSYLDYDSIKKFQNPIHYQNTKNKDNTTTYHNKTSCNQCSDDSLTEIVKNQNSAQLQSLNQLNLVPCKDCATVVIDWLLEIHGSTGNTYKIKANMNKITCTCIDFNRTKNCCKHILYVFFKVLDNMVDLNFDYDKFNLSSGDLKFVYYKLSEKFVEEQKRFNEPVETTEDRYSKTDNCPVCYDFLGEEPLSMCAKYCKNAFHTSCINLWIGRSDKCPMCRNKLTAVPIVIKDNDNN